MPRSIRTDGAHACRRRDGDNIKVALKDATKGTAPRRRFIIVWSSVEEVQRGVGVWGALQLVARREVDVQLLQISVPYPSNLPDNIVHIPSMHVGQNSSKHTLTSHYCTTEEVGSCNEESRSTIVWHDYH